MVPTDPPPIPFASAAEWEAWLEANHASADSVWIKLAKKGSGIPSITMPEAIEGALCWGWIDGHRKSLDDRYYLQRFSPRRARSKWSKVNVEKVARLTEAGRMRAPGIAEVDRAKADGRWAAAAERPSQMSVPDDLERALQASSAARKAFDALGSSDRYVILYSLADAKRPETRARRLAKVVATLEAGE